jgi:hypothetical protein
MTIDELCRQYEGLAWIKGAMEGLLDDLPEHYRSEAPREVYDRDLYDQIEWLIHDCKPPYAVEEIEDDRVPDAIVTRTGQHRNNSVRKHHSGDSHDPRRHHP